MYSGINRDRIDVAQRAELDGILSVHGERWVIVGPCLDSGWYAWPRGDENGQRVHAPLIRPASKKSDGGAGAGLRC
jgi:hypothetical protein